MQNIILGNKGFVSNSIKDYFKKNKINGKFIGKNRINFLDEKSVIEGKKIFSRYKQFNLIIISAIAPAKNIDDYEKNIIIIKNIIKTIDVKKIKKAIYISSDAVYSDTKKFINERSETEPNSIHGLMHLHREKLLRLFLNKKLIIVRPTLLFGSKDPHNSYGPNKFIREAKSKKNIFLHGKGEEKRDHLYVNDLAEIIALLIKNKKIKNQIFNAVSGKTLSFYQIAQIVKKKYSNTKLIFKKRTGPMPHLGLRRFNNYKLKKYLNKKIFSNIQKIIELY
jgi:UDP-glucose 4-epimerase